MRTLSHTHSMLLKRSGASAVVCARAGYEGQPSNRIFAGLQPTDREEAGP